MHTRRSWTGRRWPAVALFAASVAYVAAFPHHLGDSDEPLILYEAKRLLHGALFYRDIFEIITPGSQYLFAALFGLFGTTLTTARLAMAVAQGAIATLVLAACRIFAVRWPLAIAAALAHLALAQPVWPYASPHWLTTLLLMLLFVLALRRPWASGRRGAAALGALLGVVALVQQQKAAMLLPAVAAAVVCDRLLDRRYGNPRPSPAPLAALLLWLLAGLVLVAAPALALLALAAGPGPMYEALVHHPLTNYPALHAASAQWGSVSVFSIALARYTLPALLRRQPLVLIPVAVRLAVLVLRRQGEPEARGLATLLIVSLGALASIGYFPDFIHLAFIAPLFFVALAELLERVLRLLTPAVARPAAVVVVAILLAGLGVQLTRNLLRARAEHPVHVQTAFGPLDLRDRSLLDLVDEVERLVPAGAPREVFCYPECPALHLLSGTDNPTPYQKLLTGYSSPDAIQSALRALDARRPPLAFGFFVGDADPVARYVLEHYERVGTSLFYLRKDTVEPDSSDAGTGGGTGTTGSTHHATARRQDSQPGGRRNSKCGSAAPSATSTSMRS